MTLLEDRGELEMLLVALVIGTAGIVLGLVAYGARWVGGGLAAAAIIVLGLALH